MNNKKEYRDNIVILQCIYNKVSLLLGVLFLCANNGSYITIWFLSIIYINLLLTFFLDTSLVMVIDYEDDNFKYFLRFFPFFLLIFLLSVKKLALVKLIILIISLIITKNMSLKDEYKRLAGIVIYIYCVTNIFVNDFYLTIIFLYLYYILDIMKDFIVIKISNNRKLFILLLEIYMRYFLLKKIYLIGFLFSLLIFSLPFFFFYLFDARILGIFFMNMILILLLAARYCYIKTISDTEFALKLAIGLSLSWCDKFFTIITTLLQFEVSLVQDALKKGDSWVVHHNYELYREKIRNLIEKDIYTINEKKEDYIEVGYLESILIKYYELAEQPFKDPIYLLNKYKLSDYKQIEYTKITNDLSIDEIKLGLLENNHLEVRVKNPLYFTGFFSSEKFFFKK